MNVNVSASFTEVEKMVKHIPGLVEKAATQALNRTNNQVTTIGSRLIAKAMGIPVRSVRAGMFKVKAMRHNLKAVTAAKGRPLNLIRFNPRQVKRGVSAKAWGKRKIYRGAFIGNKGRTVFIRKGKTRLPIRPMWGPAIPATMLQSLISKEMTEYAGRQWQKNFTRGMRFYLSRAKY